MNLSQKFETITNFDESNKKYLNQLVKAVNATISGRNNIDASPFELLALLKHEQNTDKRLPPLIKKLEKIVTATL